MQHLLYESNGRGLARGPRAKPDSPEVRSLRLNIAVAGSGQTKTGWITPVGKREFLERQWQHSCRVDLRFIVIRVGAAAVDFRPPAGHCHRD
jgi:hypothetical protein